MRQCDAKVTWVCAVALLRGPVALHASAAWRKLELLHDGDSQFTGRNMYKGDGQSVATWTWQLTAVVVTFRKCWKAETKAGNMLLHAVQA